MRRRCLYILLTLSLSMSAATSAAAQDDRPNRKELIEQSFDPESFGHTTRLLVSTGTGFLILDPACDPDEIGPLGPDDRCVVLAPAPATTDFDEPDMGRLTLPGNSAKNLLLQIVSPLFNYQFLNQTGVPQGSAVFQFVPYLTIESEALKDPRAVDPLTNLPYNGKLVLNIGGQRNVNRSLAVNERIREQLNYSRAAVGGLSKSLFKANHGLPEDIINRMFRQQMTVRLGIRGRARLVSDGFMNFGLRLMGN